MRAEARRRIGPQAAEIDELANHFGEFSVYLSRSAGPAVGTPGAVYVTGSGVPRQARLLLHSGPLPNDESVTRQA